MAKRLIPLLNRVLVEKIVPPSKTHAGILLPEKATKVNSGKVVAVGPGIHGREGNLIPVSVKEGDTVLLPEYGGTQKDVFKIILMPYLMGKFSSKPMAIVHNEASFVILSLASSHQSARPFGTANLGQSCWASVVISFKGSKQILGSAFSKFAASFAYEDSYTR
ncbi:10 kDa chaperonin [Morella rubra]|uniref:10 kDa chaperonin n=1 Tax=Morella rubra TaxID=262757 RepID=A0A6A1WD27_9ROSI|nr:10 kDa chaperonin [Morella rubra]